MKNRYRVFRRPWGVYYCEDLVTKKQTTLKTRDKDEAYRLVAAKNETEDAPAFSLHLARVYWKAGDPAAANRTWQHVMDEIPKLKTGETQNRWLTAIKDKALDSLRNLVVLETQAEHFLKVLENGSVSTNIYLRRIHNFALDMNWLPWPVLPKKRWPAVKFKEKRGITWKEHQAIVAREQNPERKAFYQLAWHWAHPNRTSRFWKRKTLNGKTTSSALPARKPAPSPSCALTTKWPKFCDLPGSGPLFPYLRTVRAGDRATEFQATLRWAWHQRRHLALLSLRMGGTGEEGRLSLRRSLRNHLPQQGGMSGLPCSTQTAMDDLVPAYYTGNLNQCLKCAGILKSSNLTAYRFGRSLTAPLAR